MKKIIFISLIIIPLIYLFVLLDRSHSSQTKIIETPAENKMKKELVFKKAKFKIITNETTRIFTDPKYHNQDEYVFIENADPSTIIIKKENTKWSDFFNTLPPPMKLTKECLTTGTGQIFCNNDNKKLYFYLNDKDNPEVLSKDINDKDELLIEYK